MKISSKQIAILLSSISLSFGGISPALADNHTDGEMSQTTEMSQADTSADVVTTAANSPKFETLAQAIQAAGLAETLAQGGPYTIFAPTDAAFAKLPDGALEYLLMPENQELLQEILLYHVVEGEVTAEELSTGDVDTLGGGLAVRVAPYRIVVNDATVVDPNIQASNGVIHAVNRVLMSSSTQEQLMNQLQSQ